MILYEFLYIYEIEWICYDKLRNRNDDDDDDNLMQEWVVEKDGDTIRFESKLTGEYLMGNLEYYERSSTRCEITGECTYFELYWMYVEKDNPNWWKLIPANI